jgi:hypothetical protein
MPGNKRRLTMELVKIPTPEGDLMVRTITDEDIEPIVSYWHEGVRGHMRILGIDKEKLGTPEDTRSRLIIYIPRTDQTTQPNSFAIDLNGQLIGYSNINPYSRLENYPHVHLVDRTARSGAYLGLLAGSLFNSWLDSPEIDRLVLQTRTRVVGINQMLDRYVEISNTRYVSDPDGFAGPGEFHTRYLYKSDRQHITRVADDMHTAIMNGTFRPSLTDR